MCTNQYFGHILPTFSRVQKKNNNKDMVQVVHTLYSRPACRVLQIVPVHTAEWCPCQLDDQDL